MFRLLFLLLNVAMLQQLSVFYLRLYLYLCSLKSMFAEVSEKRKESFLQLKERLKQAADVINELTA